MNSTEGAPLQAAHFLPPSFRFAERGAFFRRKKCTAKRGPFFGAPKKWAGYHRHSVEILPTSRRSKLRSIAQLAMK
jgi:hypothetical protein